MVFVFNPVVIGLLHPDLICITIYIAAMQLCILSDDSLKIIEFDNLSRYCSKKKKGQFESLTGTD